MTFAMVDGRVLMRDRVITFVDERALIARAQACGERLLQRVPYRLRPRWPVLARHGPGVTLTPSPASGARDAAP